MNFFQGLMGWLGIGFTAFILSFYFEVKYGTYDDPPRPELHDHQIWSNFLMLMFFWPLVIPCFILWLFWHYIKKVIRAIHKVSYRRYRKSWSGE